MYATEKVAKEKERDMQWRRIAKEERDMQQRRVAKEERDMQWRRVAKEKEIDMHREG